LIFNLYPRVLVKVGDGERHIFDQRRLMFTEAAEIEKVTGVSYAEWLRQLGDYSITAVAALLHILRKREGTLSDFRSMQFNVADLDVVPLHEDDREFTPEEVAADLAKRAEDASRGNGAGPTRAAAALAAAPEESQQDTNSTNLSSLNGSGSARGSGNSSRGRTSASSKRVSTPS